jgi:molecular chaperone HtpG
MVDYKIVGQKNCCAIGKQEDKMAKIKMSVRLLETITSALYDDPLILFREYVQNSIDAYNAAVYNDPKNTMRNFFVDINVDTKERIITIKDNGYGISKDLFLERMTGIGDDTKSNIPDQIGFRGIGRLSAFPYCKKLTFHNKPKDSTSIMQFSWDGTEFKNLLNHKSNTDLSKAIDKIAKRLDDIPSEKPEEHFFKVIIEDYDEELALFIDSDKFSNLLCTMLPLNYNPKFKAQTKIKKAYSELMGDTLDKFAFNIVYNGEKLYKPYSDDNILGSDIVFLEFKYKEKNKDMRREPIGLLWFTFNYKIVANKNIPHCGIFVRSKNILMGDNNALATAIFRDKTDDYITSYRELTQAIQGLFGELLINSPRLSDNTRRDWFEINADSIELRDIISDFLKRLHTYRYQASKAFNADNFEEYKPKLEKALAELISNPEPKEMIDAFRSAKAKHDEDKKQKSQFEYANEDIPHEPIAIRRIYDKIIKLLKEYFISQKNKQEFLKVRTFIKKGLNKE